MIIIGADPGYSGALAVLDDGKLVSVVKMPIYTVRRKRTYDLYWILDIMRNSEADIAAIEAVTRPGVLVGNRGFLHGCALALGMEVMTVPAPAWKKHFMLSPNKAESIDLCHELYPQTKSIITKKGQDGMAEAILIARYALETSK